MPRRGSPPGSSGSPAPVNIGTVAKPPFAVVPDPTTLYAGRAARLSALAPGHELEGYLRVLAALVQAQDRSQGALPPPGAEEAVHQATAGAHGMPPIAVGRIAAGDAALGALDHLLGALDQGALGDAAAAAVQRLEGASTEERRQLLQTAADGGPTEDLVAERVLAGAALQLLGSRLASTLDPAHLKKVADGVCPACGSPPVASMVVGWQTAAGSRFCCCSVCSTLWHVVRIKCLLCGTDRGVSYHGIEGGSAVIKAETCDACKGYVKILHQHNDAALEPFADDVASLGLDLLLRKQGWRRGAANLFLAGY